MRLVSANRHHLMARTGQVSVGRSGWSQVKSGSSLRGRSPGLVQRASSVIRRLFAGNKVREPHSSSEFHQQV